MVRLILVVGFVFALWESWRRPTRLDRLSLTQSMSQAALLLVASTAAATPRAPHDEAIRVAVVDAVIDNGARAWVLVGCVRSIGKDLVVISLSG